MQELFVSKVRDALECLELLSAGDSPDPYPVIECGQVLAGLYECYVHAEEKWPGWKLGFCQVIPDTIREAFENPTGLDVQECYLLLFQTAEEMIDLKIDGRIDWFIEILQILHQRSAAAEEFERKVYGAPPHDL